MLKKIKNYEKDLQYGLEDEHVSLFVDLEEKSNTINKLKNKYLKSIIILVIFCFMYVFIFKKSFIFNDSNIKIEQGIDVFTLFLAYLMDFDTVSKLINSNINIFNLVKLHNPQVFDFAGNFVNNYLNLILLVLLFLSIKLIYEIVSNRIRLDKIKYLWREKEKKTIDDFFLDLKQGNIGKKSFVNRLSIDYYCAMKHKEALIEVDSEAIMKKEKEEDWFAHQGEKLISIYGWGLIKIRRKFLIELNNWGNLLFSSKLFIVIIFTNILIVIIDFFNTSKIVILVKDIILILLLLLLLIRIISRGIEVAISFYTDVVKINSKMFYKYSKSEILEKKYINKFNASLLRSNARLSLAIHTLIEIILLFAMVYWLIFMCFTDAHTVTIVESLLFSFSISVFNFSFMSYPLILLTILHVVQVSLSVILILISIAQYIGGENLTQEEQEFYADVAYERKRREGYQKSS